MSELGVLTAERTEFIGGVIFEIAPQTNVHSAMIDHLRTLLETAFGFGYWVRQRGTLNLSPQGVPDPDIAVILGDKENPTLELPTTSLLVVEVSDSSLRYDRTDKASLYAACGIAEYWIVNIPDRQLEIRREPQADAAQEFGHGYASLTTLRPGATATPLAGPDARIPVEQMVF